MVKIRTVLLQCRAYIVRVAVEMPGNQSYFKIKDLSADLNHKYGSIVFQGQITKRQKRRNGRSRYRLLFGFLCTLIWQPIKLSIGA